MSESAPDQTERRSGNRIRGLVGRHPVISATLLLCTTAGVVLGVAGLTPEWSIARRVLAGAAAGAGTGLLLTATKMLG